MSPNVAEWANRQRNWVTPGSLDALQSVTQMRGFTSSQQKKIEHAGSSSFALARTDQETLGDSGALGLTDHRPLPPAYVSLPLPHVSRIASPCLLARCGFSANSLAMATSPTILIQYIGLPLLSMPPNLIPLRSGKWIPSIARMTPRQPLLALALIL